MSVKQLKVSGMSCRHCQRAVQDSLLALPGIKRAEVDLNQGTVTVEYDAARVDLDDMKKSIEDAGYGVNGEL
ncbi:MAG: heavy-metal-associated domain-containing protein [Syntrophomonadaceae bacterium]|nr:heavy-metal-associated domain-containing protein [Syntrophomonadaceae bacterium]